MPKYALRLTQDQHTTLRAHLLPEDGCEAVALALCGRRAAEDCHVLVVRDVVLVPYSVCSTRTPDRVTWPTEMVEPLVRGAYGLGQAIVKFHSHRSNYRQFSSLDDQSDDLLFSSISSLLSDGLSHASVIMLPDASCIGRAIEDGVEFQPMYSISVVGDDILRWNDASDPLEQAFCRRNQQVFGKGTVASLRTMAAAVVGCSGTGSLVVEQLSRFGIGRSRPRRS